MIKHTTTWVRGYPNRVGDLITNFRVKAHLHLIRSSQFACESIVPSFLANVRKTRPNVRMRIWKRSQVLILSERSHANQRLPDKFNQSKSYFNRLEACIDFGYGFRCFPDVTRWWQILCAYISPKCSNIWDIRKYLKSFHGLQVSFLALN